MGVRTFFSEGERRLKCPGFHPPRQRGEASVRSPPCLRLALQSFPVDLPGPWYPHFGKALAATPTWPDRGVSFQPPQSCEKWFTLSLLPRCSKRETSRITGRSFYYPLPLSLLMLWETYSCLGYLPVKRGHVMHDDLPIQILAHRTAC